MSTKSHKRIEEVLESLEGVQQAKAPAFLYTRLKARMDKEFDQGFLGRWLTRPALALSIAAIILVLNATTILEMFNQAPASGNIESAQIAASDYVVGSYAVYEENSVEP